MSLSDSCRSNLISGPRRSSLSSATYNESTAQTELFVPSSPRLPPPKKFPNPNPRNLSTSEWSTITERHTNQTDLIRHHHRASGLQCKLMQPIDMISLYRLRLVCRRCVASLDRSEPHMLQHHATEAQQRIRTNNTAPVATSTNFSRAFSSPGFLSG